MSVSGLYNYIVDYNTNYNICISKSDKDGYESYTINNANTSINITPTDLDSNATAIRAMYFKKEVYTDTNIIGVVYCYQLPNNGQNDTKLAFGVLNLDKDSLNIDSIVNNTTTYLNSNETYYTQFGTSQAKFLYNETKDVYTFLVHAYYNASYNNIFVNFNVEQSGVTAISRYNDTYGTDNYGKGAQSWFDAEWSPDGTKLLSQYCSRNGYDWNIDTNVIWFSNNLVNVLQKNEVSRVWRGEESHGTSTWLNSNYFIIGKDIYEANNNSCTLYKTSTDISTSGMNYSSPIKSIGNTFLAMFYMSSNQIKVYKYNNTLDFELINTFTWNISLSSLTGYNMTRVFPQRDNTNNLIYSVNNTVYDLQVTTQDTGEYASVNIRNVEYYNTKDALNVNTEDVLQGKTLYTSSGKLLGSMTNNGALTYTPTTSQQTIPSGYTSGGTISAVTSSIDNNIVESNIKDGVTILGVTGTLEVLDTSDADAVALNIRDGKTAYVNGQKITGTLPVLTYPIDPVNPSNWDYQFIAGTEIKLVTRDGVNYVLGTYQIQNGVEDWMFTGNSKMKLGLTYSQIANKVGLTSSILRDGYTVLGITGSYGSSNNYLVPDGMKFAYSTFVTVPNDLDTSGVTDMTNMFRSCTNLTTAPSWNTSNVTNMDYMFYGCTSLTTVPLYNTSNVTRVVSMFSDCTSLTTVPLFDLSSATTMDYMFYGCTNLTVVPLFTNTNNVTSWNSTFRNCKALTTIPLIDTSGVTNISSAFYGCTNLTTIPLLDTSNVTNMSRMFQGCTSLSSMPAIDTSNATNMSNMFSGCTSLVNISLDLSNCTDASFLINASTNLETATLTNVNKVVNASSLFNSCTSLETVNIQGSGAFKQTTMFTNCTNLKYVTIGIKSDSTITSLNGYNMFRDKSTLISISFPNTGNSITNVSNMFSGCTNLTTISVMDVSNVTNMSNMFSGCTNLSDQSLDNILQICIGATSFTGTKTLYMLGLRDTNYSANRIQTLAHYQDFIDAGWTIGY